MLTLQVKSADILLTLQMFWDLQQAGFSQETDETLKINSSDVLGKGGYGFVCKGELTRKVKYNTKTCTLSSL